MTSLVVETEVDDVLIERVLDTCDACTGWDKSGELWIVSMDTDWELDGDGVDDEYMVKHQWFEVSFGRLAIGQLEAQHHGDAVRNDVLRALNRNAPGALDSEDCTAILAGALSEGTSTDLTY